MSEPSAETLPDAVEMGKLLSEIADADGDAGTIMRLIDAFAARKVAKAVAAERERLKTELAAVCRTCAHATEASPRYTSEERQAVAHCLGVVRDGFGRALTTAGSRG